MTGTVLSSADPAVATGDEAAALRASFDHCRRVTRREAKNFYYGLKLTPEPKRSAMYAVYAWMRAADDLADEPGDTAKKARLLDVFRQRTYLAIDPGSAHTRDSGLTASHADVQGHEPIWPAMGQVIRESGIPVSYLDAMIDGQLLDQHKARYASFDELYDYCYKVASVVGMVCVTVWGYQGGADTLKLAEYRGLAFQLTNILRDLVEDARRDRVYLPTDEIEQAGCDPSLFVRQLLDARADAAFDRLMTTQIDRARRYYEMSADLDDRIDPACRRTSRSLMRIYRRLLDKIAHRPRRVLSARVRVGRVEKLAITLSASWGRGGPQSSRE